MSVARRLYGVVLTIQWIRELTRFAVRTMCVWDRPDWFDKQSIQEWEDRVSQGPMRYEYERVEKLKEEAARALAGEE